ncbi:MAG: LTA synthase family protein, partial [Planctomycetota bacterium]
ASWTRAVLRPLWIFGFNLALLCVARLLLLLFNRQQFEALSGSEVVLSLLRGLRFDLSLVATFAGLPVLMLLLPFRWSSSRPWQLTWSRLCLVLTCASLMVVVVDLNYFALVHRHLGVEVAASTSEFSSLAALVLQEYPLQLLVLLSLPVGLLLFWPRLERWDDARRGDERPAALVAPLALVLLVLGMRGGFGGKPLNIVNAFESGSLARGYLELNAPFSLYHSLRNSRFRPVEFMEEEEAYALSRDLLVGDGEVLVSPDELPLQRRRAGGTSRPNVVVIVMESWGAHYVDSLRERRGLEPLGATPHFDALAREGLLLERLYCAGQLSIHGLAAVLAGVPSLPNFPWMGRGIEQSELSYLGHIAAEAGYQTHFLRGAKRSSFRLDAISALAGFETYMGMEDLIANTGQEPMEMWGSWDEDLFAELHRMNQEAQEPFLGFCFTVSTHEPYQVPEGFDASRFEGHPEADYLASLAYSDACLGRFLEQARAAGDFEDTVFLITSDHVRRGFEAPDDERDLFHIPGLLIGPGIQPGILSAVCGQTDLLPTLCDAAGWPASYSPLGRSLLQPLPTEHGTLCLHNGLVMRIEEQGFLLHNLRSNVVASLASDDAAEAMTRRLEALVQATSRLLLENRFYRRRVESALDVGAVTSD